MQSVRLAGAEGIRIIMETILASAERERKEKVFLSTELFGREKQILIKHGEVLYRLLITRQGKLILNK